MLLLYSCLVAAPPLLLLGGGLVPSRWANRHVHAMRRGTVTLLAITCGLSALATAMLVPSYQKRRPTRSFSCWVSSEFHESLGDRS